MDRNVVRVGRDHPDTALEAAAKALPRSGTLRRLVFDTIAAAGGRGATDDEIEQSLDRSHQSVSGARNTLLRDAVIFDSGQRRQTRYRNDAIAWVTSPQHQDEALPIEPARGGLDLDVGDDWDTDPQAPDDDWTTDDWAEPTEHEGAGEGKGWVMMAGEVRLSVPGNPAEPLTLLWQDREMTFTPSAGRGALQEALQQDPVDPDGLALALGDLHVPVSALGGFAAASGPWSVQQASV